MAQGLQRDGTAIFDYPYLSCRAQGLPSYKDQGESCWNSIRVPEPVLLAFSIIVHSISSYLVALPSPVTSIDMDQLPPDHFATSGAYTPHIYRDQYPSIDPTTPALSQAGKVVIITGASAGIGARGFAPAFAKAHPKAIVLVGRSAEKLNATKAAIEKLAPQTDIVGISADLTDAASVAKLFTEVKSRFGHADVLINNAGAFNPGGTVAEADPKHWWMDFEVNVKGTFLVTQAFLKLLGPENKGSIVNMSTAIAHMVGPGMSAYSISKLASIRLAEYVAAETPNVCAVSLQPGVVNTEMVTGE